MSRQAAVASPYAVAYSENGVPDPVGSAGAFGAHALNAAAATSSQEIRRTGGQEVIRVRRRSKIPFDLLIS